MITIDDLSVSYGAVQALRDVSMSAETGKITAVLGANGAGKTTLLRTISGLKSPATGSITDATTARSSTSAPRTSHEWASATSPKVVASSANSPSKRISALAR